MVTGAVYKYKDYKNGDMTKYKGTTHTLPNGRV